MKSSLTLFPLTYVHRYWLPLSLLILFAISLLSLWPLETLPSVPGSDKTHHFIAYMVLAFPTALRRPHRWLYIIFFFILYSGCIELIQPYVNRYGEWLDMLANTTGVMLGILLAYAVRIRLNIPKD